MADPMFCKVCGKLIPLIPNGEAVCFSCREALKWNGYEKVVRCQDCKKGTSFKRADGSNIYICDKVRGVQHGNWYCADGERKENNA